MTTQTLTGQNFHETVTGNDIVIVLVDFWASCCGRCREFAPVFQKASQPHPEIVFGKVDTEAERELAAAALEHLVQALAPFDVGAAVTERSAS